jgi:hypothetical protein
MKKLIPAGLALAAALIGLSSAVTQAQELHFSNKWRLKFDNTAKNDGVLRFRVTPKGETPIEVSVPVVKGRSENEVARDASNQFRAALDAERFHVEVDDGEDVLIKKKHKGVDTAVELLEDNVDGTEVKLHRE